MVVRKKKRIQFDRDEIENFHPLAISYLASQGFMTKHHVNLASGHEIDIVAQRGEVAYIVECKPQLHKQNLFNAIGQVLAYCSEYGGNARPAIVGFHDSSNQYARDTCKALGIWLIELERSVGVPTQEQETDECLGLAADSS